jgi:hypothetical protein
MTTPAIALAPVTYQNIGVVTGFQIAPAGLQSFNVYNGDLTNVLLVSHASTPSLGDSIPVQPLTNATISGGAGQWYASAQTGTCAEITVSASSQISPSPAQIATQISLLGLATSANQASQITQETAIAANTSATETAVGTVNNTLGNPAQNTTTVNPNPYLFGGSSSGYSAFNGASAVTSTPVAGCPEAYALVITPNGASQFPGFTGGAFPVTIGNYYMARGAICLPFTDANIIAVEIGIAWYSDIAGTVQISTSDVSLQVPAASQWVWLNSGQPGFQAPATAKTGRIVMLIQGTANVAAGDIWQAACMPVFTNLPGPPAQESTLAGVHDRIANTGVPLLHGTINLANGSALALPINTAEYIIGSAGTPVSFGGTGYDGYLSIDGATSPTVVTIILNWYEGTAQIDSQSYYVYVGQAGSPHNIYLKGPTRGNGLTVSLESAVNASTLATYNFNINGRTYLTDNWRSTNGIFQAGAGIATPEYDMTAGLIMNYSVSIPGSTTETLALPLWNGKFTLMASTTAAAANDLQVVILPSAESVTPPISPLLNAFAPATGLIGPLTDLYMRGAQCQIRLVNNAAGAETVDCVLMAADY